MTPQTSHAVAIAIRVSQARQFFFDPNIMAIYCKG
jgi:hypothetical protein